MKKRNVLKLCLVLLSCCAFALGMVACKKKEEPAPSGPSAVSIDKEQVSMLLGDELRLKAKYQEKEGVTLVWSSSDSQIASVDANGNVSANGAGNAVITATYGEDSATCALLVGTDNMLPVLKTEGFANDGETVRVSLLEMVNITPKVAFNNKTFTDGEWTYTLSDPTVGSVLNGTFVPAKKGRTTLTIAGSWRGMESDTLMKTVTVEVVNAVTVSVNGGSASSVYLYTQASHGGRTYQTSSPFHVSVEENGLPVAYTVEVTSGAELIDYNATQKKITALSYGTAEITVTFTDSDGDENQMIVPVYIQRPVTEYGETIEYFSAMDGELPLEDIFGGATTLTDAYQGEEALTVTSNKVTGVKTSDKKMTQTQLTVFNATCGYVLNVEAYTKVIKSKTDISVFNANHSGYFVLAKDIDCSGMTISNSGTFSGVFEGKGHSIQNAAFTATSSGGGMFGILGANAHIRNVGFTGVRFVTYSSAVLAGTSAAGYGRESLVENVYIQVTEFLSTCRFAALTWRRSAADRYNNIIVDISARGEIDSGASEPNAYGVLFAFDSQFKGSDNDINYDIKNVTNVSVIAQSDIPVINTTTAHNANYAVTAYAKNDGVTQDKEARKFVYTGVTRYSTLSALAVAELYVGDLDGEEYWTVTESGVEWLGEFPPAREETYGTTIPFFSAMDGELPLEEIFGTDNVKILAAYQGGTELTVENNRVLGVVVESDRMTETDIKICTLRVNYILHLEAYTKVIDEESDFAAFTSRTTEYEGYFVMKNDVVCTSERVWEHNGWGQIEAVSAWFNGIFDGLGHTVSGMNIGEAGLFGGLGKNAIIRNVAFTEVKLDAAGTNPGFRPAAIIAKQSSAATTDHSRIENVYIQIADFRVSTGGNRGAGLVYIYNPNLYISNVIVKIDTASSENPEYGYGALFEDVRQKDNGPRVSNTYIVSSLMPVSMNVSQKPDGYSNYTVYAGNDVSTEGKITKNEIIYFNGVNRYDTLAALSSAHNRVGNWTVGASGVTWHA